MQNKTDSLDYPYPDFPSVNAPPAEIYTVIGILSFLSVVGTAGNALVLYVFYQKTDKQVSTLFIIVLAFTDFITCLIVIPYTVILESMHFLVNYDLPCKLYQFLITSNIPFSALIMVAIAIDRYLCICHPFLHALDLTRAKIMTAAMGIFSAGLGVIVALMHGVYDHMGKLYTPYHHYPYNYTDKETQMLSHPDAEMNPYYNELNAENISNSSGQSVGNYGIGNPYQMTNSSHSVNATLDIHDSIQQHREQNFYEVMFVGQCRANEIILGEQFRWYYQRFYTVLYLICLLVVIVLYSLIYKSVLQRRTRRARQRSKALPLVQLQNTEAGTGNVMSTVEETLLTQVNGVEKSKNEQNGGKDTSEDTSNKKSKPQYNASLRRKSTRRDNNRMANLKTAAMLFVVTVVFIITFFPAFLMALDLIPYNMIVFYMYFANNVANPVIYSFMNKNFRDDLKRIFCKPQVR